MIRRSARSVFRTILRRQVLVLFPFITYTIAILIISKTDLNDPHIKLPSTEQSADGSVFASTNRRPPPQQIPDSDDELDQDEDVVIGKKSHKDEEHDNDDACVLS